MLPSRSSTPRPRQVGISESSLMDYTKDPSTSTDPSWDAMTVGKINREPPCVEQTVADTRPRKRRRITSSSSATTQVDFSMNHSPKQQYHSDIRQHANGSVQLLELGVGTGLQETCQTCRKCISNYYCSRCSIPTCSICTRTCTVAAISTPPTPLLCFSATPSPRLSSNRLPMDDSSDGLEGIDADDLRTRLSRSSNLPTASKRRSSSSEYTSSGRDANNKANDTSWLEELSPGGCGRVICQACVVEDADSHESTCLDCLDGSDFLFSACPTSNSM
ncbi:hypothetical protein RSOLAG1IB_00592 [Rhizoctonia solani AG-1 IB]|uniref:B box-type domain-containing protein n=1 Tax=Thanatephorus cucumeris (strain AG1-IB / isolate 7/3/14) TaxID=1108050 RepID=A0A0B7F3H1_THACB|nr:hypothetical protein RSOLAG1IB_00592 [Rhizoctonia solani AG-1 IB]